MNVISYLREKGIKHALDTIWRYKLDIVFQKIILSFTRRKPLNDCIVIESHNDFDSNGGAFYDHLIAKQLNQKYTIVWLLKHPEHCPAKLPSNVKAVPFYRPSFKKDYYLCTAKYILCDGECIAKFRDDQISVFSTHGPIGLKNTRGLVKLPENLDYCLTPSEGYADVYKYLYEWDNCDKMIFVGYPMHDVLYRENHEIEKITSEHFQKVILWMPTFRKGSYGRDDFTEEQSFDVPLIHDLSEYQVLNQHLHAKNALLIIKIHPRQNMEHFSLKDESNIKVLTGETVKDLKIDNYRLMSCVDALISDYSSAAYDFLHCNKPIAYMHNDEKDYKLGYIVDDPHTMMAGREIFTYDDLVAFIQEVLDENDPYCEQREALLKRLFKYQDGNSCQRLQDFLKI